MTQSKSVAAVNPDQQADRAAETKQALLTTIEEFDDANRREDNRDSRWKTGLASGEDWWVWELAGLVISAIALVCIFVLLRRYDNKQQPEWEHLSLNTAVALLSTLGKASVLIAVSRGLGQLKWIWLFNTERSLADLQLYDAASRSVSGCLILLWKLKASYLASIGSVAVILALGFDPSLQNLIHYYSKSSISTTQIAHVTNSTSYKAVGPKIGGSLYYIDSSMKANLYGSILSPNATQQWGVPTFICSTGDCTWDPVATLAIRPLCSDITSRLETSCSIFNSSSEGELEQCFVSLSGSQTLSFTNDPSLNRISMNMTVAGLGTGSTLPPIVYDNQTFPVIRYVSAIGNAIGLPGTSPKPATPDSQFIGTECALEPYVVSVQPSVNKSVYSEVILEEWSLTNTFSDMNITADVGLTFHPPWGPELGMERDQTFTMSFTAWNSIGLAIMYMFNGSIQTMQPVGDGTGTSAGSATGGTSVIVDQQVQYYPTSEVVLGIATNNYTSHTNNSNDKLSGMITDVAQALTKSLRDTSYIANGGLANENAHMATGRTLTAVTFVRVQWAWLTLPVVVWFAALITWIGTAWETRRLGVRSWGNNILPLLFLYREEAPLVDGRVFARDENSVSSGSYMQRAEGIRVKLQRSGNLVKLHSL